MEKLQKYTLRYNRTLGKWELKNDQTNRMVKTFNRKEDAVRGGVLQRAVGREGGSVKIQKQDGKFEEERTYPGSRDPRGSRG